MTCPNGFTSQDITLSNVYETSWMTGYYMIFDEISGKQMYGGTMVTDKAKEVRHMICLPVESCAYVVMSDPQDDSGNIYKLCGFTGKECSYFYILSFSF